MQTLFNFFLEALTVEHFQQFCWEIFSLLKLVQFKNFLPFNFTASRNNFYRFELAYPAGCWNMLAIHGSEFPTDFFLFFHFTQRRTDFDVTWWLFFYLFLCLLSFCFMSCFSRLQRHVEYSILDQRGTQVLSAKCGCEFFSWHGTSSFNAELIKGFHEVSWWG